MSGTMVVAHIAGIQDYLVVAVVVVDAAVMVSLWIAKKEGWWNKVCAYKTGKQVCLVVVIVAVVFVLVVTVDFLVLFLV